MRDKKILTIKDWHGEGKGNLNIEVVDFAIERRAYETGVFDRLTIRRKPDRYSSRIGIMAYLNNSAGRLSWGFTGMTLKINEFAYNGVAIRQRELNFRAVAVEKSSTEGDLEVISLVSTMVGQFCAGRW